MIKLRWKPTLRAKLALSFLGLTFVFMGMALFNLVQVERMKGKIDTQNEKAALEHKALELKVLVQDLKDLSSGLMISRNSDYIQQYQAKRTAFEDMIKTVGDTAATDQQHQWRSQLIQASTDFLSTFDRAVAVIQNKTLKEDDIRLNTSILYDQAQEQRNTIFGLVDKFDADYAKDAQAAVFATKSTMNETVGTMIVLSLFVLVLSTATAVLLIRSFLKPVRRLQEAAHVLSEGDLRVTIGSASEDELGALSRDFDRMTESVRTMIGGSQLVASRLSAQAAAFRVFAGQTAEANEQIVRAIGEVAAGSDQQAMFAEASAVILDELSAEIGAIARLAEEAEARSFAAGQVTESGRLAMGGLQSAAKESDERIEAVGQAMQQLLEGSKQIGKIVTSMTDLASQTNVLALNASIEAARAGTHGRGFAVVAEQIRLLSAESGASSKQIAGLIARLQRQIAELGDRMDKARHVLSVQNGKVGESIAAFAQIRHATDAMSVMIAEVGSQIGGVHAKNVQLLESVHQVAAIAQESAAAVEQVGASTQEQDGAIRQIAKQAEDMQRLSGELYEQVSRFRIAEAPVAAKV